jgi:hypothetical protein
MGFFWQVFKAFPLGVGVPLLIGAASVSPHDAASNFSRWAEKIGIHDLPLWLTQAAGDRRVIYTALAFVPVYGFLAWGLPHWRSLQRGKYLQLHLERDSVSYQYGVHTFGSDKYIQVSATATKTLTKCRAWIKKIEFDPDGAGFSLEHGEGVQCRWSRQSDLEIEIRPGEPPARLAPAIYNTLGFFLYPTTPTNLVHLLQKIGVHRFHLTITGLLDNAPWTKTQILDVNWHGPMLGATIQLVRP